MEEPRTAIVVPAFNEESTIASQVSALAEIGDVIVVNDGSTDRTQKICQDIGCRVINFKSNVGYDLAIEVGIKSCLNYDFVITTDADGEIPIASVVEAKEKLYAGAECVLGIRDSFPRFAEKLVNSFVWKRFRVKDIFCGLKGYKIDEISSDFSLLGSVGSGLAIAMLREKKRISTVSVRIKPRNGESRFGRNDLKTNFRILRVLTHV